MYLCQSVVGVKPKRRNKTRVVVLCVCSRAVYEPLVFGGTCEERSSQLPHPSAEHTRENKRGEHKQHGGYSSTRLGATGGFRVSLCVSGSGAVSVRAGGSPLAPVLFNPPQSEWGGVNDQAQTIGVEHVSFILELCKPPCPLQAPYVAPDCDVVWDAYLLFHSFLSWPEPCSSASKRLLSVVQQELRAPGDCSSWREPQGTGLSPHMGTLLLFYGLIPTLGVQRVSTAPNNIRTKRTTLNHRKHPRVFRLFLFDPSPVR